MFTGIIEAIGNLEEIEQQGTNVLFRVRSPISSELKVDQSLNHNGVCLTVTEVNGLEHSVTAIRETLEKSNLANLKVRDKINLERSMLNNGRFDGHIVQGHVDQIGTCTSITDENGSWIFTFEYDNHTRNITVEKGSISVNGVSLTCFNSRENSFQVAIIPYTFENTNFHLIREGDTANLEFDIIGKYVERVVRRK